MLPEGFPFHQFGLSYTNLTFSQHLLEKKNKRKKCTYSLYSGHLEYEPNNRKVKESEKKSTQK